MRTKTIYETIEVDRQGNANCKQEITYHNNGVEPLEFSGIHETIFHSNCDEFNFERITGLINPSQLPFESEPYQKRFRYELTGTLPPNKTATLVLNYKWWQFKEDNRIERIATQFDSLTSYTALIKPNDDTFTNHLISVYDGENLLESVRDYSVTQEGYLQIIRRHLSPNSKMCISIRARIKKIDLPVVNEVGEKYAGCLNNNFACVVIVHLLRDSILFLNSLLSLGFEKSDLFIIGIPYSSKGDVVEHLKELGFNIYSTNKEFYLTTFNGLVKNTLETACEYCVNYKKKLLIIEDGGYAVPLLHEEEFQDRIGLCVGAVEQTANGIWADEEIAEAGKLSFPVMDVARSRIKDERESPLVGKAVFQNINRLLEGYGVSISSQKVGQIGFGNIGKRLAQQIKTDGAEIVVYDHRGENLENARKKGFEVVDNLQSLFSNKTMIIGCTGQEIVGLDQLRNLDRNVFFVNATSKLRELKYKEFLDVTQRIKHVRGSGTEYRLKGGKRITIRLLADGFPINFYDAAESIPDQEIQFIPALMLLASVHLIQNNIRHCEIMAIPELLENELKEIVSLYDETQ